MPGARPHDRPEKNYGDSMGNIVKRNSDPERAQGRRNQVLDAAAVCFARSGFHGASMAEISKQAGMSAGHIYNYFDSKDAIIMAFVAMRMERITALLGHMEAQDDPLDFIHDDIASVVDQHLDPGFWGMSLEIYAEASRNPVIATALQAADAGARGQLWRLIKRGRQQRGLAADDATIDGRSEAMISLYNGLPLRALHHPDLPRASMVEAFRVAVKALLMT
jgi:AcrR family transcriptional regulator